VWEVEGIVIMKKKKRRLPKIEFIDSSDECQFIYRDFEQAMGDGEKYSQKALKPKLMAHYGKSLFVTETPGKKRL